MKKMHSFHTKIQSFSYTPIENITVRGYNVQEKFSNC